MIRSITRAKGEEELDRLMEGYQRLFIVGCGTCTTMLHTGGVEEVEAMRERLLKRGKAITGRLVVPVACDALSVDILDTHSAALVPADALLIMTCAFGVQNLAMQLGKPVIPALDTLFIGKERGIGLFDEVCTQCGDCILGETGGLCPVTSCHKGLVNGPCGGTNNGKCEIDSQKDCVWTLIYERLKAQGRLERMRRYQPPRNHQVSPRPGKILIPTEERRG
jgi:ferredoxin